ncbi:tetratricopeptide repeat-containing sensor histidine kinase [Pedobacter glucosidilyticus]|uniref:tetratricopeptide repeat-containing sensor histidine kinase n=1 Tax=Pedobacter glucosidilyticus TaxID=1122941 RepID=UPI0004135566|nr:tetratricopeptide repeat protein [Pedobacter glucosidilyticus]
MKTTVLALFLSILFSCSAILAQSKAQLEINQFIDKTKAVMGQPDSMLHYADLAYQKAKTINDIRGLATAAKFKGVANYFKSDFKASLKHYQEALKLYSALKDTIEIAKANLNIATTYSASGEHQYTITYALKALRLFEKIKEENGQGRVNNLLGMVYHEQANYKQAMIYFKDYLQNALNVKDLTEIASAYNNIGSTFTALNKIDSAIYYLQLARQKNIEINNLPANAPVLINLGELFVKKRNHQQAIIHLNEALILIEKIGNQDLKMKALYNLGYAHAETGKLAQAEQEFKVALQIAQNLNDKEILYNSYAELAKLQQQAGKYQEAYEHIHKAFMLKDSVLFLNNQKSLQELQTQYETSKKEQQITNLNQKNLIQELKIKQRNLYLFIAAVILTLVISGAYFIYQKRRAKEKQLILKARLEKQILEEQARQKMQSEKVRISRELHDHIGSYLTFINNTMTGMVETETQDYDKINQVKQLTTETIKELRKTVWLINKEAVSVEELAVKLRDFFKSISFLTVTDEGQTAKIIDATKATEIFRIVQEAVNNTLKHAKASLVDVKLEVNDTQLDIMISDNGKGFKEADIMAGFGLANMKNRAAAIGGVLHITSDPHTGTSIHATVKLS